MIKSKEDLAYYLEADRIALKPNRKYPPLFCQKEVEIIWKYQIILRRTEYWTNKTKGIAGRLMLRFWRQRLFHMDLKLGFHIPCNVAGPGLSIAHFGNVIINGTARIGKNCRIHPGVVIGLNGREPGAALIGDNVYLASGAKILGKIIIADNVVIGANSVVTKSIPESGVTYAGVPARKISNKGSSFPDDRRGADLALAPDRKRMNGEGKTL